MYNKKILAFISLLVLTACAQEEVAPAPEPDRGGFTLWQPHIEQTPETPKPSAKKDLDREIPVDDVARKLNLGLHFDELGFHEKRFDPCALGYKTKSCETQLFTMINFQVVCRDSEGTIQSNNYTLTPLALKPLHLKVGSHLADSQTDQNGFSQIRFLAKTTARETRFILSSPPFLLALHAGEVKKIVVPNDWCQ
jgi:hypothetical protein